MERHSMTEKRCRNILRKQIKYRVILQIPIQVMRWVDARNYDLCLNSGKLGFEKCVEEIKAYIKVRFAKPYNQKNKSKRLLKVLGSLFLESEAVRRHLSI